MQEINQAIENIRDAMMAKATDDHGREMVLRAYIYAARRVAEGSAKTVMEAKFAFSSFADGFCTGFHQGNGSTCTR